MSYFYSHLVGIDSINFKLDEMDLSDEEKLQLAHLLDSSLHHTILDAILSQLSDRDKRVFINHLKEDDRDEQSSSSSKIWKFLNEKIDGVEDKIKKSAEDLKLKLHEDLKKANKLR